AVLLDQPALAQQADRVREAVYSNFVVEITGKKVFAWSIDLEGHWDIYDEPPGSLQLLPFYGFCALKDEIWKATVALIRGDEYEFSFSSHAIAEIGCKHAPHPWVLSICNSLLSGHQKEAVKHLKHAKLDNGVACESVHEDTGECTTGFAFATCAGFLSYALLEGMR
ncbi:MAG: glycoside hydrolase family 125 protein, partial [Clostridiales bacterium]|nr:glycoside hydrolase family 125 protein [Clostridiales bacterium]